MIIQRYRGGVDSIIESADSLPLKLNQLLPPGNVDFHETLQTEFTGEYIEFYRRILDIYCQSKDVEQFLNLQGKLEPLTLRTSFVRLLSFEVKRKWNGFAHRQYQILGSPHARVI